uniref:Zinc finger PMZ-type domain-containing protein n=1 Tax=Nicotiana tabacum TaxID=4097 RepID=A0A1S3YK30_TOBAC|nr:PREDICTED: uncharacterized protein LOC107777124 [Nicotiana tabacum]
MRRFVDKWITDISPIARMNLEKNKDASKRCKVLWNGDNGFEISNGDIKHIVDLSEKTCTYRTWMLREIPCPYAIFSLYHLGQNPDDLVEHWYIKTTFMKAYQYFIQPIHNMKMWPELSNPSIEPPEPKPMSGRPKICRRKSKDEPRKKHGKLSKKGVKMTCSKSSVRSQQNFMQIMGKIN